MLTVLGEEVIVQAAGLHAADASELVAQRRDGISMRREEEEPEKKHEKKT